MESKTKCVFQAWQNSFGSVWSSMSIGLSLLHYSMKSKRKQNKKVGWCFTTNIYPTCISRAFQMHFSSPEECIWHWFPIMFSLGLCWLMTYSILLMCFLCIKVAIGIENTFRTMFGILQEYRNRPRIRKNMLRCIF